MKNNLDYINSGNPIFDLAVKQWIDLMPDGFSVDFAKDCSRQGNPKQYKVIISRN